MDVLRLYWKILVFSTKIGWRLTATIIGWIPRSKPQTAPGLQQPVPQAPVPPAQPVQVVIHNIMPPLSAATAPPAASATAQQATPPPPTMAQVLRLADHGIYVTDRSTFVLPHPDAEGLLERLDYILFQAAHRDGDPYSIPPALDDSGPTTLQLALPDVDTGFDDVPPHILAPDDGLWVARLGRRPELLGVVPMPYPLPSEPITDEETPEGDELEDVFDHPDFDPVSPRRVPLPDGRLWVARYDAAPSPLDAVLAHE